MEPASRDPIASRRVIPLVTSTALVTGAFFLSTHHAGWLFTAMNESAYALVILGAVIVPVIMMIAANINAALRRWMLVLAFAIYEVSCYVMILALPNPVIPQHMMLDPFMAIMTFLNAGASTVLLMVSFAWLLAMARAGNAWSIAPGLAIAGGGLLAFMLVPSGLNGWLIIQLLAGFVIAVAIVVRFGFMDASFEERIAALVTPAALATTSIHDTVKALKLVLFTLACVLFMAVSMGLAGIGGTPWFHVGENAFFHTGVAIGAPAVAFLLHAVHRSFRSILPGPARVARAQLAMLLATGLVACTGFVSFAVDLFVPGFHGTAGAQVVLGVSFSTALCCYAWIVSLLHPPRSFNAHVMLFFHFILVAVILGGVVKAIYIVGDPVAEIAGYFDIVAGILLALVVPCAIACVVTWCKTTVRGDRPRA